MRSIGVVLKKNEMLMVAVRHGLRRYFLDGYRIVPFLDCRDEEKEAVILHNLERFLKDYRGASANIFAALPRSDAFVQYVHLPLAAEDDLHAAIGFGIDRHSPFGEDEVYYDCRVVRRMPDSGQLYVMLVIVQRAKVDFFIDIFKKLNVRLHGVELTTTALVNGHAPAPDAEDGFDAATFTRNAGVQKLLRLIGRRVPAAAKLLVDTEAQALDGPAPILLPVEYLDNEHYELGVVADNALHYSRVFPCAQHEPDETQVLAMLQQGRQACIHLPFDQVDERPLHCVLSGREIDRGFLAGLSADVSTQVSVVTDVPLHPVPVQGESLRDVAPLLFVPVSLALKGLTSVSFDINLIPPALRPRRRKSKRALFGGAACCLLLFCIVALAVRWDMSRSLEQEKNTALLSRLSREYRLIENRREEIAQMERLYQAGMQISSRAVGKLDVLRELTEIIPENAWLTEFNYRADRSDVRLSGYAVSASQLLPALEQSGMFENVRFTSPITTDLRLQKEQFRLEMKVKSPGEDE
jgi:Tfp pilus assembly protein PilN